METLRLASGSLFANRFEIDRAAGSGGMSTVYRARDRYSGEVVALKLLRAGYRASGETERFAREAVLLSELRHPGIVAHIAHGQTPDGLRFLAMEWLDGEDLSQYLVRGPLSVRQCVALLERIAEALAIAHLRGIVHRDLKPSNLFLPDGQIERVKILDFGIARRLDCSQALTRTGTVVGTPEYMSPEQAHGGRDLLPAADIFSLGCVLYECLTGQPPFVAEHIAAVLVRILFEEPPPIEEKRPGLPAPLLSLLGRLLCKDPAARIPNASALREALCALGEIAEPALARTVPAPKPAQPSFAESEQGLFSVVLAAPPDGEADIQATRPGSSLLLADGERQALLQRLISLGAAPDFLATGALVVTVPALGSAQDQATLAARAGLLIKSRWPAATVSVATGRGVIRGHAAVGEVVEQAARILRAGSRPSAAEISGEVRLDALSGKLLEGRFAQTPQPDGVLLLGVELEVDASRPLLGKPTPCVGREAELSNMEAQLRSCIEEQEARVILITASPGMGKSRLRHEFLRRVAAMQIRVTVLYGCGDLLDAGAPYGILAAAIRRLCGLTGGEPLETKQQRLRAHIAQRVAPAEQERVSLFLGELCGIPFSAAGSLMLQAARRDPKLMADALRRAALDWLRAECAASAVLLVLDDLQWGDALTVSLLNEALQILQGTSLCVVALARPEIHQALPKLWQEHQLQETPLKPLSKKACERLIQQVLGKEISAEAAAHAVEQSAGNALYLEEMIRAIAEGKSEERSETVIAMLQARIGRLETGPRRALRAASVFGQTFWQGGVAAILDLSAATAELAIWLSALVEAELVQAHVQSRLSNQPEYGFRHALVRDAAYNLLTAADVAIGHRVAGEWLEAAGEQNPRLLAEHFDRGGEGARAAAYYLRAAEQALERGDYIAASIQAQRGIALGQAGELVAGLYAVEAEARFWCGDFQPAVRAAKEALSLSRAGSRTEGRALHASIFAAMLLRDGDMLREPVDRLLHTIPETDAIAVLATAFFSVIISFLLTAERDRAELYLRRLEQMTVPVAERDPVAMAWVELTRSMWACHAEGDFFGMLEHTQSAITHYQHSRAGGYLPYAQLFVAAAQGFLGLFERAEIELSQLLSTIPANGIEALSLQLIRSILHLEQRRLDEASALAASIAQEASARSEQYLYLEARLYLMEAHLHRGDLEAADSEAASLSEAAAAQPYIGMSYFAVLAGIRLAQGRAAEAAANAEHAYSKSRACGMGYCVRHAMLLLVRAEAFYALGNQEAACQAIGEARGDLLRRASLIPDVDIRRGFLQNFPDHRRTLALAQEWLGESGHPYPVVARRWRGRQGAVERLRRK